MKTILARLALLGLLFLPTSLTFGASSRLALTPKGSTLGLGADLSFKLLPRASMRLIGQQFLFESRREVDQVDYDIDLDLQSAGALIDVHPFDGRFHLSAGMLANGNELDTVARLDPTSVYAIGGSLFTGAELGEMDGHVTFAPFAPYLGLGWGNPFAKTRRLGFTAGLGLIHQKIDQVELRSTNPLADPLIGQELEEEERRFEDEVEGLELYPVMSLGMSIRF